MDNDRITCSDAGDQVSARCRLLSLQPAGFEAVEAVEVDKVGAAEAGDDWEPASVQRQTGRNDGEQHVCYV